MHTRAQNARHWNKSVESESTTDIFHSRYVQRIGYDGLSGGCECEARAAKRRAANHDAK